MDGIHPRPFCQITITPIMSKPMALMVPVGRQGLSMVLQAITCGGFLHFWQTSTQQAEGLPDMLRGWSWRVWTGKDRSFVGYTGLIMWTC